MSDLENCEKLENKNIPREERLIINKMDLINFKSYSGIQSVGPFHKNFTSVVGPNGSGKSNVIDALLFVLGFRAKTIRQKRVSDLIHRSDNSKDCQFCQVNIYFESIFDDLENEEEFIVSNESQFVISRKADRNNSSTYFINGTIVKMEKVVEVLKNKGVDLDNHRFLILQGEVEQIAMMKPKGKEETDRGLLEYLEEIIGSDKFKSKITETEAKVEDLTLEKEQKFLRLKTIQQEKIQLDKYLEETLNYITKKNKLSWLQSKFFQLQRMLIEEECHFFNKELEKKVKLIEEKKKLTQESFRETEVIEKKRIKDERELRDLEASIRKLKEKFNELEKIDAKKREDGNHCQKKRKNLKKTIKGLEKTVLEDKKHNECEEETLRTLNERISDLKHQLIEEERVLDVIKREIQKETQEETKELELQENQLEPYLEMKRTLETKYEIIQSEHCLLIVNNEKSNNKKNETLKELESNKQLLEETKRNLNDLVSEKEKLIIESTTIKENLKRYFEQEKVMFNTIQLEKKKLEESKSSFNKTKNRSVVLEKLLEQQKNGTLCGIYGRLGSLGTINEMYDVAVTTACSSLNNIVVDTVRTAQKCADYLRLNQIGRVTFIILDQISQNLLKGMNKIKTPENTKRLFDLITPRDKSVIGAFYFALRDTLVSEDLQQATRISKMSSHRIVTLKGDIVDPTGTISGGGSKLLKGGMSAHFENDCITREEIDAHENEIKDYQEKINKLTRMIQESSKKEKEIKNAISECDLNARKKEMELTSISNKCTEGELTWKKESQPNTNLQDQQRLNELTHLMKTLKPQLEQNRVVVDKYEKNVRQIKTKILDIGGPKLKQQKLKVEQISKECDQTMTLFTKSKVSLKATQRKVELSIEKIIEAQKELENTKIELEKIKLEFNELDKNANELNQSLSSVSNCYEVKKKEVLVLEKNLEQLKNITSESRSSLVDYENEKDCLIGEIKNRKEHVEYWRKLQSSLEIIKTPLLSENNAIYEIKEYSLENIKLFNKEELEYEVTILDEEVKKLKPNLSVIKDFEKKRQEYDEKRKDYDEACNTRDEMRTLLNQLKKDRLNMFMDGYNQISIKLKEMYQMITLGGDAELEQVNSLDPFEDGIVFSVRPPKKSWKNISNLSGGEKTLSSLALVFALHYYKPTPLYVMDEIDAALDFKNVSIVANYIKNRTKNAQFIIISLRNNMFELANRLIGIYKTEDQTKSVAINPDLIKIKSSK